MVQHPLENLSAEEAARIVEDQVIGEVVIEPAGSGLGDVLDVAFACIDARAEVKIISSLFQVQVGRSAIAGSQCAHGRSTVLGAVLHPCIRKN